MARKKYDSSSDAADNSSGRSSHGTQTTGAKKFVSFAQQLAESALIMRQIHGDGNCLFRALADQLCGNSRNHLNFRREVVEYMGAHSEEFAPFLDEGVSLHDHLRLLAQPGTFAGNDAIVAFARIHNVTVVIHQLNQPCWTAGEGARQLHISYHNGEHYNSIRRKNDLDESPADVKIKIGGDAVAPSSGSKARSKRKGKSVAGTASASCAPLTSHSDEELAVALRLSEGDLDQHVQDVQRATGCTDSEIITDLLVSTGCDVSYVIAQVLQLQAQMQPSEGTGLWSAEGTATRLFGPGPGSKTPAGRATVGRASRSAPRQAQQPHLSNKERKALARQEKQAAKGPSGKAAAVSSGDSDSDGSIVVDIGVMKI